MAKKQKTIDFVDHTTGEVVTAPVVKYDFPNSYPFRSQLKGSQAKPQSFKGTISRTVPDQSYTVQEIMTRFASGLPIEGIKVPVFQEEDMELPDMKKMDIAEREQYIKQTAEQVKEIRERLNKMAAKRKAAKRTKEELEFQEWQRNKRKAEQTPAPSAGKESEDNK